MSQTDPSTRHLFILGATHHRVPIEVREKLALSGEGAEGLRQALAAMPGLSEFTLLNTCNRIEFYGVAESPAVAESVRGAFCERQGFDASEFDRVAVRLADREAIQHLLEVASGLDSQMLGETEIFGQVKDAYSLAVERGSTGAILNRIFQKAFQAAKQVRTDTSISVGQVSVANVAVDLAATVFGELSSTRVLLVGAGEIGEKTAKAFQSRGARDLTVTSRSLERAATLASCLGAATIPFDQREQRLADYDIVVCATSAPGTVISTEAARAALHRRPGRPLLFIDLALPRDVEPAIGELSNAYLYNLDDLAKVAEDNRRAREAEVQRARGILADKAAALWRNVASRMGRDGAA